MLYLKQKETEKEEYERLLKEEEEKKERIRKTYEEHKKRSEEYKRSQREREARIKYLEEKFNPKKDEISIIIPDQKEERKNKFKEERKNKFEEIVKKYPNISFEEAILRSFRPTGVSILHR